LQFYSTNNKENLIDLKGAVLKGLAADKGLYMPEKLNQFDSDFLASIEKYSFSEIAFETAKTLLGDSIEENILHKIVSESVNFDAPVKMLSDRIGVLELWHGQSLAFKDFGARFMSRLMSHFVEEEKKTLHILVATSGDTGGAVALGFYKTANVKVTILYPKGKVSEYQELQLTTLGENITALKVNGTFDDCQALVKQAFLDEELREKLMISSANSINIARLIPQTFYYMYAYKQLKQFKKEIVMVVPSGNFGNLTAGLFCVKMGLPDMKFVAALNHNDGFAKYLDKGTFEAKKSVQTLSSAMDVGNPSNLARINDLFDNDVSLIKNWIESYAFSDEATKEALKEIYSAYKYIADPHGAVGYLAAKKVADKYPDKIIIFQETAHPSKFIDIVEPQINEKVEIPSSLKKLIGREQKAIDLNIDYASFKNYLLSLIES